MGTGRNCVAAADAIGGPKCQDSQVGLCCNSGPSSHSCLTLFGDGPIPVTTLGRFDETSNPTVPTCAQVHYGGEALKPFCCDEMDLPTCTSAAVESKGFPGVTGSSTCVVSHQFVQGQDFLHGQSTLAKNRLSRILQQSCACDWLWHLRLHMQA